MPTKSADPAAEPASEERIRKFFTASDLATFCDVDLKTIHNWADKGKVPFFRTPGRHSSKRRGGGDMNSDWLVGIWCA